MLLDFLSVIALSPQALQNHWRTCVLLVIATCLIPSSYNYIVVQYNRRKNPSSSSSLPINSHCKSTGKENVARNSSRRKKKKGRSAGRPSTKQPISKTASPPTPRRTKQPYEVFLVLDIEGTCKPSTDFNYPNEIIEFPVAMLRWIDRDEIGTATKLEVVDEFRTFVRPTWRPTLSAFCMELTGITQEQVDAAPLFQDVLVDLELFLVKHGLIEEGTRRRLKRFCWCSDGPWDIRDFFVKQCFISQIEMPGWIRGDVLDVRYTVLQSVNLDHGSPTKVSATHILRGTIRPSLNIPAQLKVLGLPAFEGRQHSGIDDTRNIAKIITELARRGVPLLPNTTIYPGRRWRWMGKHGQILEDGLP